MRDSQFEELCDRFEASWRDGKPIRIENLIQELDDADSRRLLQACLEIELEYRIKASEEPSEQEYCDRFEEQADIVRLAFSVVSKRLTLQEKEDSQSTKQDSSGARSLESFGSYKVLHAIGRGGMGEVYLAEQTEPVKRRVAIKVIKTDTPTKAILARFEAERQALAMMDHHNIAKVLDAGETDDGRPYFAMELVRGVPITEYCDANKLSPDERLELFVQTCRAIQHAHTKGIVHRDIKPSNVLVTMHDGQPTAKVIDFGLAKALHETTQLTKRTLFTQYGQVIGTLAYMSPEQAKLNALDIDTRTDVYSLGVILYELLTGSTPITHEQIKSEAFDRILALIREADAPRPSARLSNSGEEVTGISERRRTQPSRLGVILRGDLDWIAVKALEKDRTRRYDTAAALADDVQRFLKDEAIEARPPSFGYRFQKTYRKHRTGFLTAASILSLLVIGLVSTATMWYRASQAESLATELADENRGMFLKERETLKKERVQRERAEEAEQRASESETSAKFQLANARWETDRVADAIRLLWEMPVEYRKNFEWNLCYRLFQGSSLTLYGHTDLINCVAFSPDGMRIASGSYDNTVILWDSTTGEAMRILREHEGSVHAITYSPDGNLLASGGSDNTIKLWDPKTGAVIRTLKGHSRKINGLSFTADGTRLASASDDQTIRIWEVATGKLLTASKEQTHILTGVGFNQDGSMLAAGSKDHSVKLWDTQNGQLIQELKGHTGVVTSVTFSPDGSCLASASSDQDIRLWDITNWKTVNTFVGHGVTIEDIAFSPDGSTIASAAIDQKIKLWEVASGDVLSTYKGHTDTVTALAFSPDGTRIVSASHDSTIKLWDRSSGVAIKSVKANTNIVDSFSYNTDGTTIASVEGTTVRIREIASGKEKAALEGHTRSVNSVAFSPNGSRVVSGGVDKEVRQWSATNGELIGRPLIGHTGTISSVAYSPTGDAIASAGWDKTVRLWDSATGKLLHVLEDNGRQISVAFSPDGKTVVSGDWNGGIRFWDVGSGEQINDVSKTGSQVRGLAFNHDGSRLAWGSFDHSIRLWDFESRAELQRFRGHSGPLDDVAFNPDESRLLSSSSDGKLKFWDIESGDELVTFGNDTGPILCASFSPDGNQVASSGYGGTIDFWNGSPDHEVKTLCGHSERVIRAEIDEEGRHIFSQSKIEKRVWSIETGQLIPNAEWKNGSRRDRHGRWLLVRSGNRVLLVDTNYKNTATEKAFRQFKAAPKPWWHEQRFTKASNRQDWYAACFHSAWLLKLSPRSLAAYHGLQRSRRSLDPALAKHLPAVVNEALALPEPAE